MGNPLSIPRGHLPHPQRCHNGPVDVFRTRQDKVRELIREQHGGTQASFADRIGQPANYVSRMLSNRAGKKNIGEKLARLIEERHGKPVGWLDGLGLAGPAKEGVVLFGIPITREGVQVGAEWEKLDPSVREQVRVLIETMVAAKIREARPPKAAPPRSKQETDLR